MRQHTYLLVLLVSFALSACDGGGTELDASVESDGGTDASVDIDASVESDGGIDASVGCTGTDPCDDGDPCTEGDVCSSGICVGTAVVCDTPDAPTCIDDNTLRTYSPSGS